MEDFIPLIMLFLIWFLVVKPVMGMRKTGGRPGGARTAPPRRTPATRETEMSQNRPDGTGEAEETPSEKMARMARETEARLNERLARMKQESPEEMMARIKQEAEWPAPPQPELTERQPFDREEGPYRGSLDAETGEGEDPCHEEQMESLRPEPEAETAEAPEGGLELQWTGNDIVKGFVMSEVLKRRS